MWEDPLPEGVTADGYGIRLSETDFYRNNPAARVLPADTVLCLHTPVLSVRNGKIHDDTAARAKCSDAIADYRVKNKFLCPAAPIPPWHILLTERETQPMKRNLTASLMLLLTAMVWGFSVVAQVLGADHLPAMTFNGTEVPAGRRMSDPRLPRCRAGSKTWIKAARRTRHIKKLPARRWSADACLL